MCLMSGTDVKILLLMPNFFDYPQLIMAELRKNYIVDVVYNECKEYGYFWNKSFCRKVIRKGFFFIEKMDIRRAERIVYDFYYSVTRNIQTSYDYVVCIKGDFFPDAIYESFRKRFKNAKFILYQWDDVSLLQKKSHFKYFDKLFFYNVADCRKYKGTYLPVFSKPPANIREHTKEFDIAVIGTVGKSHRERLKIVNSIYRKYKGKYKFFVYLYSSEEGLDTSLPVFTVKLPYDEYISVLQKSKCVLDIAIHGQKGPTTRFNDALSTKTKVMTTNGNIRKYPYYTSNILILNKYTLSIPASFLDSPYDETDLQYMTVALWTKNLLSEKDG